MRIQINTTWNGLDVTGELIIGDWYGDNTIPNGTKMLDPYIDDMDVYAGGESIIDWLTEEAIDSIEQFVYDEYADAGERDCL
jgi:hypothetical protein